MKSSDSYSPEQAVAVLLIGEPGSGKTRVGMCPPGLGVLDCDGNLNSAVRIANGKKFLYSEGFRDDAGREVPENLRWEHAVRETKTLLADTNVKWFFLDGLSNLCRWGLIHAETQMKNAGIDTRKEYLAKYNAFIPLLTNYITTLRIPKKPIIVSVHQTVDKSEFGALQYYLDIPGKLSSTLSGQFTDSWGMRATPDPNNATYMAKYEIWTRPTGYHPALKTSSDLPPATNVTGKSLDEIWALLEPKLSYNVQQKKA